MASHEPAIHRIAAGGSAIDPTVIEHLLERRRNDSVLAALTERERDVLAAMAEGRSNRSIASTLHISEKTVEASTSRIFTKLGLQADTNEHVAFGPCSPICKPRKKRADESTNTA